MRPLRYRHALESFAEAVPGFLKEARLDRENELFEKTSAIAQNLGGYLRSSYRYYNELPTEAAGLRDKIKSLSILRDQVACDRLTLAEARLVDDCLCNQDPALRLARLDQHIVQVLRQQIKLPTLRLLELADEWLDVYEELLHA